jgi:hypothetical protein
MLLALKKSEWLSNDPSLLDGPSLFRQTLFNKPSMDELLVWFTSLPIYANK